MNWGTPPEWTVDISTTKAQIERYIRRLKEEGKTGWITLSSTALQRGCESTATATLFGRHLKTLGIPKKKGREANVYALYLGDESE